MNINPFQLMQMMQQFKANPMAMLSQFGIPQNMADNPQGILQQMMNKGNITQAQYNNAVQMARNMGYKI